MGDLNLNSEREICRNIGDQKKQQYFHVLAVDDSRLDRKLLERLLTVSSYQVTFVDSGYKALEYLGLIDNINDKENQYQTSSSSPKSSLHDKVSKINLIMTDYSMPGISGYDLLKRVKVSLPDELRRHRFLEIFLLESPDSSWRDIPVVIMSSENLPSRINMCVEGGAEDFLLKPVKLSDLRKLHSHLLNSRCQKQDKDSIKYKENTTLLETRPPSVLSMN